METTSSRTRGIERVLEIFDCLHRARKPLRVGEIARQLQAPRSSLYELVNCLAEAGLLERFDEDGRFFFGRAIYYYAADYLAVDGPLRRARESVTRLAAETGETSQYCVLTGNKYTVVHMQPGQNVFRMTSEVGLLVPIPWTASGRLLLGHMTDDEIDQFVPAEDFVLPDGSQIDRAGFYREIRQAYADGYAVTSGLAGGGGQCLAAGVKNMDGQVEACLCLVLPERRPLKALEPLLTLLRNSARALSAVQNPSAA